MRRTKALMWKCENSLFELKRMIPQLRSWNCYLITCPVTIVRFVEIRRREVSKCNVPALPCNMNAVVKRCHLTVLPLCLSLFLSRILACHLKNVGILHGRPPSFCDYKNVDFARFFFQYTVFYCMGHIGLSYITHMWTLTEKWKPLQFPFVWSSKQKPWKIF